MGLILATNPMPIRHTPSGRERLVVAMLVGALSFGLTYVWLTAGRRGAGDFQYAWLAARALFEGREPYAAVFADSPFRSQWLYPLPAALVAAPFALLSSELAGASFVGVGFAWLAYQLIAVGRWRLLLLTAAPCLFAILAVQWTPLLTAAALTGPTLGLVVLKPTIGLAFVAALVPADPRPPRRLVAVAVGASVLLGASFLVRSDWLVNWLEAIRLDEQMGQYRVPILTPYGALSALALLRWRRPEARLVFVLACVRQNGFLYDQLPLLLVPASPAEAIVLVVVSHASHIIALWHPPSDSSVLGLNAQQFPFTVAAMYIPCVIMLLRRPNEGHIPTWLEYRVQGLPRWLRGATPASVAEDPAAP